MKRTRLAMIVGTATVAIAIVATPIALPAKAATKRATAHSAKDLAMRSVATRFFESAKSAFARNDIPVALSELRRYRAASPHPEGGDLAAPALLFKYRQYASALELYREALRGARGILAPDYALMLASAREVGDEGVAEQALSYFGTKSDAEAYVRGARMLDGYDWRGMEDLARRALKVKPGYPPALNVLKAAETTRKDAERMAAWKAGGCKGNPPGIEWWQPGPNDINPCTGRPFLAPAPAAP